MAQPNQKEVPAYPRPSEVYDIPPEKQAEMTYAQPPPPAGYPTMNAADDNHLAPPVVHTQSKGDDFWKGCLAAICCCCFLDICCF